MGGLGLMAMAGVLLVVAALEDGVDARCEAVSETAQQCGQFPRDVTAFRLTGAVALLAGVLLAFGPFLRHQARQDRLYKLALLEGHGAAIHSATPNARPWKLLILHLLVLAIGLAAFLGGPMMPHVRTEACTDSGSGPIQPEPTCLSGWRPSTVSVALATGGVLLMGGASLLAFRTGKNMQRAIGETIASSLRAGRPVATT